MAFARFIASKDVAGVFTSGTPTLMFGEDGTGTCAMTGTISASLMPGSVPTWNIDTTATGGNAYLNCTSPAGTQAGIEFNEAGTAKWQLLKQTDDSFLLYDNAAARTVFAVSTGGPVFFNTNLQGAATAIFSGYGYFGPGGTGAAVGQVFVDGGSGSGGGPYIELRKNAATKWQLGTLSVAGGGTSDDLYLYSSPGAINPLTVNATTGLATFSTGVLSKGIGGVGYTTGAGGTVTQATSRVTPVTINTITGAITLFSAAGSAAYNGFVVNNSTVSANDVVILSQKTGSNAYNFIPINVQAGQFSIYFNSISGTATDSPVVNFAVIKGSTN